MLSCILALNQISQWFVAVDIDDYSGKIALMNYLFAELMRMIQIHIYKSDWSRIEAWVSLFLAIFPLFFPFPVQSSRFSWFVLYSSSMNII